MRVAVVTFALTLAGASGLRAQAPECDGFSGDAGRVCTAAVDATRTFHPVLGLLTSGGNPVLGSGNALGGAGHFSITARVNAVDVVLPRLSYDGSTATVPRGEKVFAPAPLVEGAVGIYGGLPSGVLALDGLASAQLLPTTVFDNFRVDESARRIGTVALGLGFGARVGILRETGPLPGISVSIMRRDLPTITYGDVAAGDEFQYAVSLRATNLRLVASKQFALADVAAGLGWDRYTGKALIQVQSGLASDVPVDLHTSRVSAFADAGFGLGPATLVAEAGYQGGKDQHATTDFEDIDTTQGKFFAGLGLRVGL